MKHDRNIAGHPGGRADDYFFLVRNLPEEVKIELIAKISNSIVNSRRAKKEKHTKEEILTETYGSFQSEKSAVTWHSRTCRLSTHKRRSLVV